METTTTALEALTIRCTDSLPSNHNGAGDPIRRDVQIINGHRVTVKVIGWGECVPVYEVDMSTQPLTFGEAVKAVTV